MRLVNSRIQHIAYNIVYAVILTGYEYTSGSKNVGTLKIITDEPTLEDALEVPLLGFRPLKRGLKRSLKSPQLLKLATEIENKLLNNIPITPQEIKLTMYASLGPAWIRLHPNSLDTIPKAGVPSQDLFPGVPVNTVVQQDKVINNWKATNWIGICDELSKISNPTLIITGTDDGAVAPGNSLIIAGKIPGAWLVQIKDAGHVLLGQYPDKLNRALQTFLSTTSNPN